MLKRPVALSGSALRLLCKFPFDLVQFYHTYNGVQVFRILPILLLAACFVSTAEQVAERVTDPDKIIHDYEWFHTASQRVESRAAQVAATRQMMEDPTVTAAERARLRIDLTGQQQSCRELVADYNANSQKVTVSAWKGWSLPSSLDASQCE